MVYLLGGHNVEIVLLHEMREDVRKALVDLIGIEPAIQVPGYPFVAIAAKQLHQLHHTASQKLLQYNAIPIVLPERASATLIVSSVEMVACLSYL